MFRLDWTGPDWTGPDRNGTDWTGLDWTGTDLQFKLKEEQLHRVAEKNIDT